MVCAMNRLEVYQVNRRKMLECDSVIYWKAQTVIGLKILGLTEASDSNTVGVANVPLPRGIVRCPYCDDGTNNFCQFCNWTGVTSRRKVNQRQKAPDASNVKIKLRGIATQALPLIINSPYLF
ncbi:MAG: hypothetical protein GF317_04695 [Candidatus Lokiarchaeota archaeon]|nr:hypothetical protein [Candidatus Lokiarchaeota archaeon]